MNILITGATGFIGKNVVNYIENSPHKIIVSSSDESKLKKIFKNRNVKIIPFDIYENQNEDLNLLELFSYPDKLIHLAWKGLPNYQEPFHMTENLVKDFNFLSNLIHNGLKDVTITGTCFEYGMLQGELDESMPTNPTNYYALAKDTLRRMLEIHQTQYSFNLKWVRLFYVYGDGQNNTSLIPQLERALNNSEQVFNMSLGEQIRDYLPVTVAAKNIVDIALQSDITGIINNCSGAPVKVLDFVKDYLKSNNKYINLNLGYYPYTPLEPMAFWGSNQKLKKLKCE
jgi:nucleoside-diphosphate-sugar epimerase